MTALLKVFANRRTAALLGLGFASGLPLVLTKDALQAWMTAVHVDVKTIGLFSLVGLPYAFKFLWAPVMDRFVPPLLGRRRGWLVVMQVLVMGLILGMAWIGPGKSLLPLAVVAMGLAVCSASQDIVADAYRTDVLPAEERGAGAAVFVTGYRIGTILSGAGAMVLVGKYGVSWPTAYALLAGCMGVGLMASVMAPEPAVAPPPPRTLVDAVVHPLREFLLRPEGWLVLAFVLVFKLPEVMADTMTLPFMLTIGIPMEQIGAVKQGFGIAITILGAMVGGGVVARMGLIKSLWVFGILHGVSNLGFLVLARTGPRLDVMVGVIAVENFVFGLTTAGFAAFLMSRCEVRYSATQYALLSSLMALGRVVAGAPTGYLAKHLGWSGFFALTIAMAIPGLLLLPWMKERKESDGIEMAASGIADNRNSYSSEAK